MLCWCLQVLRIILDLERLERLLEYDHERSTQSPGSPRLRGNRRTTASNQRRAYCAECACIMEDMCPISPGSTTVSAKALAVAAEQQGGLRQRRQQVMRVIFCLQHSCDGLSTYVLPAVDECLLDSCMLLCHDISVCW